MSMAVVAVPAVGAELAVISRNVVIIEAVIAAAIVALLIGILVSSRRKSKKKAAVSAPAETPNYYGDLQQQPNSQPDPFAAFTSHPQPPPVGSFPMGKPPGGGPGSIPSFPSSTLRPPDEGAGADPFGGSFPAPAPVPAATPAPFSVDSVSSSAQPAPVPSAAAAAPAPTPAGTPAGWLPDPNGSPDTLRYWDGNAWTEHQAHRN